MNQDHKITLWAIAQRMRYSVDITEYKHLVFCLMLLKYISDALDKRQAESLIFAESIA